MSNFRAITHEGKLITGTLLHSAYAELFKIRLTNGAIQHLRAAELREWEIFTPNRA